ncbi:MAG TPA: DUF4266 domain-containing protein [Polyangia bacterium]|nr:DUF4266 domain-containing protein [Polyangia bacterium]
MILGSRSVTTRITLGLLLAAVVATVSSCTHVPPFQRGRLAHPTMLLEETAGPGESHVYAIHEGAVGGGAAVEGGCGCN